MFVTFPALSLFLAVQFSGNKVGSKLAFLIRLSAD
jgi:hypothetical protein